MPRTVARLIAGLLLASSLVACGGGEGPDVPEPTRTPTRSPPIEAPTPTRTAEPTTEPTNEPEPTREPEPTTEPEPTREPEPTAEPEPTREPPTREPDPEPTDELTDDLTDEPTLEPTEEASEEPAEDPTEDDGKEESDPTWLWWLLGALLLGAAIGIPLLLRSRRRAAWRAELAEAEGELVWFARGLLPGLRQAASREEVAGGWAVGAPRVAAAEDRLTVLESSATDEVDRSRARDLRNASRVARQRMDRLVAPGPRDTWARDLDTVVLDLETALGPPPPPRPPA